MKKIIFLLAMAFLIAMIISNADLTCQIETGSCSAGYTAVLYLKNDTGGHDNAHAELPSVASYSDRLCCKSTGNVITPTCGVPFLNLSGTTNAHVQDPYEVGYPNGVNYSLILHLDGVNGSTTNESFIDSSGNNYDVNQTGDARLETSQRLFGESSAYFDGDGDALIIPDSDDWYFGTENFTIDLWVRFDDLSTYHTLLNHYESDTINNYWNLLWHLTQGLRFAVWSSDVNIISLNSGIEGWSPNTWYHIALVREDNNFKFYRNGKEIAAIIDADAIPNFIGDLFIGEFGSGIEFHKGNIEELRIIKGKALWTSNFTPPTRPYNTLDYNNSACISGIADLVCNITRETSCSPSQVCLVSIASDGEDNLTNAHVSSCNVYDTQVCCESANSPPNNVTLKMPYHGNITVFNRTPTFYWYNSTDPDGDSITYQIQIDETSSEFQSLIVNESGIAENNYNGNETFYTILEELDVDTNYSWRVRAYDGQSYSSWSENFTFVISSTVILTMLDDQMDFGEMNINDQNDTLDNSPYPFRVRNDGNTYTDINITIDDVSNDWLWSNYPLPSDYFQYKIDNATAIAAKSYNDESGAFNESVSVIEWQNVPESNASTKIKELNYSEPTDEVEIDINITVPSDEPAGVKSGTLLITGWVSL